MKEAFHTAMRLKIMRHFLYFSGILAILLLIHFSGIGCPIQFLLGFPCPSCGLTRGTLALMRFDFVGMVHYNPMTPVILSLCFFLFHHKAFGLRGWGIYLFYVLGFIAIVVSYAVRMSLGLLV